jgi:hypothetical protein
VRARARERAGARESAGAREVDARARIVEV